MTAIQNAFDKLKAEHRGGLIPYITAGYPDMTITYDAMLALAKAGATVIELGVPFSDPMADGPVIQHACEHSLGRGTTLRDVLALTKELRKKTDVPVVLFSYLNPLLQYGLDKLASEAVAIGVDGVLVTDLPTDTAEPFANALRKHGADFISLVAPTSTDKRLEQTGRTASGFIYAVSRTGVTGTRDQISGDARELVGRIKKFTSLPVALGFGISKAEHVREAWQYTDAAVVGSALVRILGEATGREAAAAGEFLQSLQG